MATEPNQQAIDAGAPTITLAGKAWPIPKLAVRQNRTVVPACRRWSKDWKALFDSQEAMDNAHEAVFVALTRAHPDLSREEFEEMAIDVVELELAFPVIAEQTGLFKPDAAKPGALPGEAPAAT